jgi:hypothetical protein
MTGQIKVCIPHHITPPYCDIIITISGPFEIAYNLKRKSILLISTNKKLIFLHKCKLEDLHRNCNNHQKTLLHISFRLYSFHIYDRIFEDSS